MTLSDAHQGYNYQEDSIVSKERSLAGYLKAKSAGNPLSKYTN